MPKSSKGTTSKGTKPYIRPMGIGNAVGSAIGGAILPFGSIPGGLVGAAIEEVATYGVNQLIESMPSISQITDKMKISSMVPKTKKQLKGKLEEELKDRIQEKVKEATIDQIKDMNVGDKDSKKDGDQKSDERENNENKMSNGQVLNGQTMNNHGVNPNSQANNQISYNISFEISPFAVATNSPSQQNQNPSLYNGVGQNYSPVLNINVNISYPPFIESVTTNIINIFASQEQNIGVNSIESVIEKEQKAIGSITDTLTNNKVNNGSKKPSPNGNSWAKRANHIQHNQRSSGNIIER